MVKIGQFGLERYQQNCEVMNYKILKGFSWILQYSFFGRLYTVCSLFVVKKSVAIYFSSSKWLTSTIMLQLWNYD